MKNIISAAVVAAMALSLAACEPGHKPSDSTSTTTEIDSTTKTVSTLDSSKHDTAKLAAQQTPGKNADDGSASLQAVKDSFKKDSAKMSRK